jgi:tetratricopeptide (TPR) repeat protein
VPDCVCASTDDIFSYEQNLGDQDINIGISITRKKRSVRKMMNTMPSPSRIWGVPYQRNPFFTGRETILERLHNAFAVETMVGLSQPQDVNGLGGIGKTQIALEFAYRYSEEYRDIFWVRADSASTLMTDFLAVAEQLQLPERSVSDQHQIVEAVQRWLRIYSGWLLIFDGVADLATIESFLPGSDHGHILLTMPALGSDELAQCVELEPMEPEVGALFLLRRAQLLASTDPLDAASATDRLAAVNIAEEMGGLPLALDQAGAYISATSCTLYDYLALYRARNARLLQSSSGDYPASVATTWSLSFEKIVATVPLASELLHLLAFLHPDDIPAEIITRRSVHIGDPLESIARDQLQLDLAISEILPYSLIFRDPEKHTFAIHHLTQAIFKASMSDDLQCFWAIRAVQALSDLFPTGDPSIWPLCQRYLLHAQTCGALIKEWELSFSNAAWLLNQAAGYLRVRAQYAEAEPLYLQALAIWRENLGPVHSDVAAVLNNLASLYKDWGQHEQQVESLSLQALAIWEETEGQNHPSIATCLFNLADFYQSQGRDEEAEPLYQRALAIHQHNSGPQDLATATVLYNLATLYDEQGEYEQAELFYLRAYDIRRQQPDVMHPDTVISLNGLAQFYMERGRYDEAEQLLVQDAQPVIEQLLGVEHPHTATLLYSLAAIYYDQGKFGQVEALYKQALAIWEQKLGPWHPQIAETLNKLAALYDEQKRYGEAEPCYHRAYFIYRQTFGDRNPRNAEFLNCIAELHRAQGEYEQAIPFYKQALAVYEKIFGPENINATVILSNLAHVYRAQGNDAQAERIFVQVLLVRSRTLGKAHPMTAQSMCNLADVYRDQEQLEQAEHLYTQAIEVWLPIAEEEHIALANAYNNLALLYVRQEKYEQANALYLRAFPIMMQTGNSKHPNMETIINSYQTLLEKMGQTENFLKYHVEKKKE